MTERPSPKMRSEHTISKTKGDAAYDAMEAFASARARQEDARRIYDQKCSEAAVAETNYINAVQDALESVDAGGLPPQHGERLHPSDPREP